MNLNDPRIFEELHCYVNQSEQTAVMRVFRRRPLNYLHFNDIAREARLTADAAIRAIASLKTEGVRIGSRQPSEYFYEPRDEILHPDIIASQLNTRWWGKRILASDEIPSTIDIAKSCLAILDDPHGLVVIANMQTQGRGRQGNTWLSPQGKDILLTFIISNSDWTPTPSLLSLYTATAAARVLDTAYGIPISIKWPNDLMVDGRKLGGVMVERDDQHGVVLASMGLNIQSQPADWPMALRTQSTSLAMLDTDEELHRDTIIAQCGTTWEALWQSMMTDRGETVLGYWKQYSSTIGKRVNLQHRGANMTGAALDIDEVGRLIFRADDGQVLALIAEEVQHLRMEESL